MATDLITKLEEAGEGSRELDWRIADATGHPSFARKIDGMWPPFCERSRADKDVPAYSTSIDAALALAERVLPGRYWAIRKAGADRFIAGLPANSADAAESAASTPALALCAAILRASEQERGG